MFAPHSLECGTQGRSPAEFPVLGAPPFRSVENPELRQIGVPSFLKSEHAECPVLRTPRRGNTEVSERSGRA
eukprot:15445305-Alexandrium_andersonii.AAC.1